MEIIKIKGTQLSYEKGLHIDYRVYYNNKRIANLNLNSINIIDYNVFNTSDYVLLQSLSLILYMYQQKTLYGQENYKV